MAKPRTPVADRLWPHVDKNGPLWNGTPSWLWQGARGPDGYGYVHDAGGTRLVHRVAYELLVGPIPPGLTVDHRCRVTNCVNPMHMELVTLQEHGRRSNAVRDYSAVEQPRQTHCKRGHAFTGENTYLRRGWQQCRTCKREANRAWFARKRGA